MQIASRVSMWGGKRLPYDAEVEYLQSDGVAYIDTGVFGTNNTRIVVSIRTVSAQGYNAPFGSRRSPSSDRLDCLFAGDGTSGYCGYGSRATNVVSFSGTSLGDNTLDLNLGSLTINGNYKGSVRFDSFTTPTTIKLFCNETNGVQSQFFSGYIYSCQIYQNGVLVRDFIPVRRGTTGYLYDRVSGKLFGNAGTGDFVLGPDVVPVEWLKSNGNAYINTGYVGTDTSGFSVEIMPLVAIDRYFFGSRPRLATDDRWLAGSYGGPQVYIGWNTNTFSSWTLNAKHIVENNFLNSRKKVCDGITVGQISTSLRTQNGKSAYIFSANDPVVSSIATCRIYAVKVSENTTLVRSFRPVRVGTDSTSWEGAMMDVLTRRIYRNAGSGAFAYGNDLKYPIPSE